MAPRCTASTASDLSKSVNTLDPLPNFVCDHLSARIGIWRSEVDGQIAFRGGGHATDDHAELAG